MKSVKSETGAYASAGRARTTVCALAAGLLCMNAAMAYAADPTNVAASSTLPADSIASYEIQNIIDNNDSTAWVEGAEGDGAGEYFDYFYPAGTILTGGTIKAGYWKSPDHFYNNGAPTQITVTASGVSQTIQIPDIAPQFVTSGNYTYVDYRGYQGLNFTFDTPLVSDGAVRIKMDSVRPGALFSDTCITELHFNTLSVVSDGNVTYQVPDTMIQRLGAEANYLYKWAVNNREVIPATVSMQYVDAHTKAELVYEYIYHTGTNDPRISGGKQGVPYEVSVGAFDSICLGLFGETDPAVTDDFAKTVALSYENGVFLVNSSGDFGDAGPFYFGGAQLTGAENGRLILTGDVKQYDSGVGQYGEYIPVATYTVFAVPNQAGVSPSLRIDQLLVDYKTNTFAGDNGEEVVPIDLVPGQDYAYSDANQAVTYSLEELSDMALAYYEQQYGAVPQYVEAEYGTDGMVQIHLYNMITAGPDDTHTGTLMWYFVDEQGVGTDIVGNYVDLRQ